MFHLLTGGVLLFGLCAPHSVAFGKCADLLHWKRVFASPHEGNPQVRALSLPTSVERYPLKNEYVGEEKGEAALWNRLGRAEKISYMSKEEAATYRVRLERGLFWDAWGRPLCGPEPCKGLFVIDETGYLYFSSVRDRDHFHHSSFVAGSPVLFAGEMTLKEGRLLEVDKESGHYRPPLRAFKFLIELFAKEGVHHYEVALPMSDGTSRLWTYDHRHLNERQVLRLFVKAPEVMNRKYILLTSDFENLLTHLHP